MTFDLSSKPLPSNDMDHIMLHTEQAWQELRGARILITGGTGFFGRWILSSFVEADRLFNLKAKVYFLSRQRRTHEDPSVTYIQGDIRTFSVPDGAHFTHVIHGAAPTSRDCPEMRDVIVKGTRHLVEDVMGGQAPKRLFISSGAAETPDTPYGLAKYESEKIFSGNILRCYSFIGPGMPLDSHFAAGNFIRDALEGGPIHVKGNGRAVRSYMYMADLMIILWKRLVAIPRTSPLEVGSEENVSIAELALMIAAEMAVPVVCEGEPEYGQGRVYIPTNADSSCYISLNQAIKRTLAWYRS